MPGKKKAKAAISAKKPNQLPRWDGAARRLWLGRRLLLELEHPAPFRMPIMEAFQAQGWESGHATVSLPISAGDTAEDHKTRLQDAIRNLNRDLPFGTIHFCGDGTGRGVRWRYGSIRRRRKRKK